MQVHGLGSHLSSLPHAQDLRIISSLHTPGHSGSSSCDWGVFPVDPVSCSLWAVPCRSEGRGCWTWSLDSQGDRCVYVSPTQSSVDSYRALGPKGSHLGLEAVCRILKHGILKHASLSHRPLLAPPSRVHRGEVRCGGSAMLSPSPLALPRCLHYCTTSLLVLLNLLRAAKVKIMFQGRKGMI